MPAQPLERLIKLSDDIDERLSRITTQWTLMFKAHGDRADAAAQDLLLKRYSRAVYRYLLGAVKDHDQAEELAQEFALRFLRGDYHRAAPERGRFRDYLKTSLSHLVTDWHRSQQAGPQQLPVGVPEPAAPEVPSGEDFLRCWREEILEAAWKALARENATYHAVLRLRVAEPDLSSAELAELLTVQLAKPVNAAWVRKTAERAQQKYAAVLIDEVEASLGESNEAQLRQELQELDLLKYCKSVLERRKAKRP